MTIEDVQAICNQLKGTTEDIKWEDHLCFNIGDKMFLITAPGETPCGMSFKTSDEEFEELCEKEGFTPARYLARYKWVDLDDINRVNKKQLQHYIRQSYELIAAKLPKATRKKLGLPIE